MAARNSTPPSKPRRTILPSASSAPSTTTSSPTFFGKRQTARDDFAILVKQVEGVTPSPYLLNVETQQAIYYYAGLCYYQLSQPDQAKDAWQRGLKLNPTSPLGVKIQAELKK